MNKEEKRKIALCEDASNPETTWYLLRELIRTTNEIRTYAKSYQYPYIRKQIKEMLDKGKNVVHYRKMNENQSINNLYPIQNITEFLE